MASEGFQVGDLRDEIEEVAAAPTLPRTTFQIRENVVGDRRGAANDTVVSFPTTQSQAARQLQSFLMENKRTDIPVIVGSIQQKVRDEAVGWTWSKEMEAKVLARKVVTLLTSPPANGWKLLSEGDVEFAYGTPKPDTFMMEGTFVATGKTAGAVAWARSVGALEWKAPGASLSPGQCAQYLYEMLTACPWRERAVVVAFSLKKVQVFIGHRWRHGRHRLRVEMSEVRNVCEMELADVNDKKTLTITDVDVHGLSLLAWGLSMMTVAELPSSFASAMRGTPPLYADDAVLVKLLGVGTSATACAVRTRGEDAVWFCVKTVRNSYAAQFATERAALEVLKKKSRDSFPTLVGKDVSSLRLLTTPVAEPLCPTTGERGRRLCALGFSAYVPLVEDLKAVHDPNAPERVFHCDVAPHNLAWYGKKTAKKVLLFDFGCAVVVKNADSRESQTQVPYSGSMWYASTSALEQLVGDEAKFDNVFVPHNATRPNTWAGTVNVNASFDLEGLVKSIAALEVPGVADCIDDASRRIYKARRATWTGYTPRDVLDIWKEVLQLPILAAMMPAFEAARLGDHDAVATELKRLRIQLVCD